MRAKIHKTNVLITGGAGYIGSHAAIELSRNNNVVIIDNLINSSTEDIARINYITGNKVRFIQEDVRNTSSVARHLKENKTEIVMHFAGLKSIRESFEKKSLYQDININGTMSLLEAMAHARVFKLTFSSSATVYKNQNRPFNEEDPIGGCISPYGETKFEAEELIEKITSLDERWRVAILRYFNPAGAHHSGLHGESFHSNCENLVPKICLSAIRQTPIHIFGKDYTTRDGTPERDYIHIDDLISGHISAINALNATPYRVNTWNLGTGKTYSVLDVIREFELVSGISIPKKISLPRAGDLAYCSANPQKALLDLGWKAKHDLRKIVEDTWRWAYFSQLTKPHDSYANGNENIGISNAR